MFGQDHLKTCRDLHIEGKTYRYFSLSEAMKQIGDITRLPFTLRILLENILRFENGKDTKTEDAKALAEWVKTGHSDHEIPFRPSRILLQDFTGVPAIVDLAAMRDGIKALGGNPEKVNPLIPVDLVVDHSVMIDRFGSSSSLAQNIEIEFERNGERYAFVRWGQTAFDNFRAVPPATGICHQVNLEYLAQSVWTKEIDGATYVYPDTLFGTDSHTTMINGLGVLGWGVGGIEAEAAMLGQPTSMLIPDVVGVRLTGKLKPGVTATDLVLAITQMLRKHGVVGKFVEFCGSGLNHISLADRATIANMAPEYGATCGFFPTDKTTIDFLRLTGRDEHKIALAEAYAKAQHLFRDETSFEPNFTALLELDLGSISPAISGPKLPQQRVLLSEASKSFSKELTAFGVSEAALKESFPVAGKDFSLTHGSVVIAAITSCTNTSNPSVIIAAGLLARKAREKGLHPKPWVKTSLAPGSQVVASYLKNSGLQEDLDALGFNIAAFGCTTCIGNSGPLDEAVSATIEKNNPVATAVLSGNRNFEGRVHPLTRANYLASPPLVVAYALLGSVAEDIETVSLGTGKDGKPVYLRDIWPDDQEIKAIETQTVTRQLFTERYSDVFKGPAQWQHLQVQTGSHTYAWDAKSTYVQNPPYFEGMSKEPAHRSDIKQAGILAVFGDSITTDHISPAGSIKKDSPAGKYLSEHGVLPKDFNSYGSRRGNHEVMMRGTFANIRIKNEMTPGIEGGITKYVPTGEVMPIFDAAMLYKKDKKPLVIIGGKEYGTGSSRDWAAKGPALLGVAAVITESFERIHRSNLVGMGVLPLVFKEGVTRKTLNLTGEEKLDICGLDTIRPRGDLTLKIHRKNGTVDEVLLTCRIDTADELAYWRHGGVLHYVLRQMAKTA